MLSSDDLANLQEGFVLRTNPLRQSCTAAITFSETKLPQKGEKMILQLTWLCNLFTQQILDEVQHLWGFGVCVCARVRVCTGVRVSGSNGYNRWFHDKQFNQPGREPSNLSALWYTPWCPLVAEFNNINSLFILSHRWAKQQFYHFKVCVFVSEILTMYVNHRSPQPEEILVGKVT